jgi:molybdopterin converting factor small subunit
MQIKIQFWGITARIAGTQGRLLQLDTPASVADAVQILADSDAALAAELPRCAYAIGTDIVALHQTLHDGDELAVLPPVSGG